MFFLSTIPALWRTDPFPSGFYEGGDLYNGSFYPAGEAVGPELGTAFPNVETIPSCIATAPDGTWIEVLLGAADGKGNRTRWYNLGVRSSGSSTVRRQSKRIRSE